MEKYYRLQLIIMPPTLAEISQTKYPSQTMAWQCQTSWPSNLISSLHIGAEK